MRQQPEAKEEHGTYSTQGSEEKDIVPKDGLTANLAEVFSRLHCDQKNPKQESQSSQALCFSHILMSDLYMPVLNVFHLHSCRGHTYSFFYITQIFKTMKTQSSSEKEFPNMYIVRSFLISAPEGKRGNILKGQRSMGLFLLSDICKFGI